MTAWIVNEGEVSQLDFAALPPRDTYGRDWVVCDAPDEASALRIAESWDAANGAIPDMALFAAAYRAGALGLPGDDLVGIPEIAQRLGTTPGTVKAWRRRGVLPDPTQDLAMGPVWWWSDVARWHAIPRPMGRPRKQG
jgi:hypothetical protein